MCLYASSFFAKENSGRIKHKTNGIKQFPTVVGGRTEVGEQEDTSEYLCVVLTLWSIYCYTY